MFIKMLVLVFFYRLLLWISAGIPNTQSFNLCPFHMGQVLDLDLMSPEMMYYIILEIPSIVLKIAMFQKKLI